MQQELRARFIALWKRIGARPDPNFVFDQLVGRYSESQRAYHTLDHIEAGLRCFDRLKSFATWPDAVEFAWFFHDVIYDPIRGDNEERSADFAALVLRISELDEAFIKKVCGLILATKHNAVPSDPDSKLIVDMDLLIFAESEEAFNQYEEGISEEYKLLPRELYLGAPKGRIKVLESFHSKKPLFNLPINQGEVEERAKRNLARLIEKLKSELSVLQGAS